MVETDNDFDQQDMLDQITAAATKAGYEVVDNDIGEVGSYAPPPDEFQQKETARS